jgi:hypothetical protein
VAATLPVDGGSAEIAPMMLGTVYIDIGPTGAGPSELTVSLESAVPADDVQWVVQALPGSDGSDGELLSLPAGVALVASGGRWARTLAVTALPGMTWDIDPDERTDARFAATLRVSPR